MRRTGGVTYKPARPSHGTAHAVQAVSIALTLEKAAQLELAQLCCGVSGGGPRFIGGWPGTCIGYDTSSGAAS